MRGHPCGTAQQHGGSHQQHHACRNLPDNESIPKAGRTETSELTSQGGSYRGASCLRGWRKCKHYRSQAGNDQHVKEDVGVDREVRNAQTKQNHGRHRVVDEPRKDIQYDASENKPCASREYRKHEALGKELPHDSAAARAQRKTSA
jgi:hypothetical protein